MKFTKAPVISDVRQLRGLPKGQWIQLAWCDRPSRFHHMDDRGNVTAFHFPRAGGKFQSYERSTKAVAAFMAFQRACRTH